MELDQLKKIWQQESAQGKEDEQLLLLLGKRSNNPIARMKRNLLMELISIIILYGSMIIYYAYAFHGTMSEVSWFMVAIALFFFVYYYRKNRLLNKMECLTCQVRSNLQRQVSTLEKYVKFYLVAGTAIAPLAIFFFGWLIYIKFPGKARSVFNPLGVHPLWETITAWTIVWSIYRNHLLPEQMVCSKLYGKHIQKLKELLAELNEGRVRFTVFSFRFTILDSRFSDFSILIHGSGRRFSQKLFEQATEMNITRLKKKFSVALFELSNEELRTEN